jgi:hypothetical protein
MFQYRTLTICTVRTYSTRTRTNGVSMLRRSVWYGTVEAVQLNRLYAPQLYSTYLRTGRQVWYSQ